MALARKRQRYLQTEELVDFVGCNPAGSESVGMADAVNMIQSSSSKVV